MYYEIFRITKIQKNFCSSHADLANLGKVVRSGSKLAGTDQKLVVWEFSTAKKNT